MIGWTDEQRTLRAAAAELGAAVGKDHLERDATGEFSRDGWALVRESGLLGLPFGTEYGGLGADLLTTMYVLEGLGEACRDGGFPFSVTTHVVSTGVPLHRFGSDELKARYLPGVCSGSAIGAHAISEPDAGSDMMAMRTTAVLDGDDYVLTGSKSFVSNGPIADTYLVYARTGKAGAPDAITTFLVERDSPGLHVGQPMGKMGLKTSPLSELFLDGVRVPAARVVGRVGAGFLVLDHVMKWEILLSFVVNLGEMEHRLRESVRYARTRKQFGAPIGSNQSVSNKLVDMRIGVETSRKWLYDTAEKLVARKNVTTDIAITKLVVSEANLASALAAVQVFGGYGYMTEYGVEKDVRNAVAGTIYSGTTEIQRQRVAAMMGLG
ncbi:acyl-CoA dehydrogenase family protein [Actinokineospora cianjurensis]|uniref:L-prolyl-[peptidyl carrier protein] dehydrogenase n=1 Tax=Actinokineospora cianjurensis TaxID=585224 RepID=A0A421B0Y5_9PSEU|nr:acyl-CoA dehydrogenase family protein [Actinokineospora cianjurensis]RLK57941.1 L-prolyl-[peptidyl carrier protein] dehydrogenase [Actinokineospora cianjurensis]